MPEVKLICLYCNHKWSYISYHVSGDLKSKCLRCKETKMIKATIVSENKEDGNVFGYDEDFPQDEDDDNYRD